MRSQRTNKALRAFGLLAAVFLLSSCAAGPNAAAGSGSAGFLLGLWHGFILPITFFISLFTDQVNVYEVTNNGNWYDFGFVVGAASSLGGGGGAGAKGRRKAGPR
ncbi:MAG: hypothetical protein WD178_01660 [Actinomycetota bacterium]